MSGPKFQLASVVGRNMTLEEFDRLNHKVLIIRDTGGAGDILMLRMIFEDFKLIDPNCYLVFACPLQYHGLVKDHPFIDEVIDARDVDLGEYMVSYNLSTACGKHECRVAPYANKHRSDIWAHRCGIDLRHHNMHLNVPKSVLERCKRQLESYRVNEPGPIIVFSPISAIPSKDLDVTQSNQIIEGLRQKGCLVLCLHKSMIKKVDAPTITGGSVIDFLGIIKASDYIVTVDTATFHAAGGLNKPMVAIFSWADGKVYGQWYDKFELVQRHRDNGDWDCGPCYLWHRCPKVTTGSRKPCITEITSQEVLAATERMMTTWPRGNDVG